MLITRPTKDGAIWVLRCNWCGEFSENRQRSIPQGNDWWWLTLPMPEGWMEVVEYEPQELWQQSGIWPRNQRLHFDCISCLAKWRELSPEEKLQRTILSREEPPPEDLKAIAEKAARYRRELDLRTRT